MLFWGGCSLPPRPTFSPILHASTLNVAPMTSNNNGAKGFPDMNAAFFRRLSEVGIPATSLWPLYDFGKRHDHCFVHLDLTQISDAETAETSRTAQANGRANSTERASAVPPALGSGKHIFRSVRNAHQPQTVPLNRQATESSGPGPTANPLQSVRLQARIQRQSSPGPAKSELTQTRRFQPYETNRTRENEHANAVAGPSTLVGPPSSQPTGGVESETKPNAEKKQTDSEEGEVTVSNFYRSHILRVSEWSFGVGCRSSLETPPRNGPTALCNMKMPQNSKNG